MAKSNAGGVHSSPVGVAVGVDGAHLEAVVRLRLESVEEELGLADGAVGHAIVFHLVVVSVRHSRPSRCEVIGIGFGS